MQYDIAQQPFLSPSKGSVVFSDILEDIIREAGQGHPLRISVGTDSEEFGSFVKFVSIIHLWKVGRGARAFRTEMHLQLDLGDRKGTARFRERIWREIMLTATLAQELRSGLRELLGAQFLDDIEVHADVGENGGSSAMIREVLGLLKGYGFSDELIKIKPEAYAASAVADHYI